MSDWDGRPERPAESGWHWIATTPRGGAFPWRWSVDTDSDHGGDWFAPNSRWCTPVDAMRRHRYLGPCLTPDQHAAAVQAERERFRVAAMAACEKHRRFAAAGGPHTCVSTSGALAYGREQYAAACRDDIAALDPGDTSALDAAIKAARAEGMERAAVIVRSLRLPLHTDDDWPAVIERAIRAGIEEASK